MGRSYHWQRSVPYNSLRKGSISVDSADTSRDPSITMKTCSTSSTRRTVILWNESACIWFFRSPSARGWYMSSTAILSTCSHSSSLCRCRRWRLLLEPSQPSRMPRPIVRKASWWDQYLFDAPPRLPNSFQNWVPSVLSLPSHIGQRVVSEKWS